MGRLGELLTQTEKHKGGRPEKTPGGGDRGFKPSRYSEVGVDYKLASRAQRIAAVPEEKLPVGLRVLRDELSGHS